MLDSLITSIDRSLIVGGGGKAMKRNARSYSAMSNLTLEEWADCSDSDNDSAGHTDEESDEDVRLTVRQKRCRRLLDDVFSAGIGLGLDLVEFPLPEQRPNTANLTWRWTAESQHQQHHRQQQQGEGHQPAQRPAEESPR